MEIPGECLVWKYFNIESWERKESLSVCCGWIREIVINRTILQRGVGWIKRIKGREKWDIHTCLLECISCGEVRVREMIRYDPWGAETIHSTHLCWHNTSLRNFPRKFNQIFVLCSTQLWTIFYTPSNKMKWWKKHLNGLNF